MHLVYVVIVESIIEQTHTINCYFDTRLKGQWN